MEEPPGPVPAPVPAVVDQRFVLSSGLAIRSKTRTVDFQRETTIVDAHGDCLFRVHNHKHRRQYLHDTNDQPLLCVEEENAGDNEIVRWKAYRETDGEEIAFFSCQRVQSHMIYIYFPRSDGDGAMTNSPDLIIRGRDSRNFTLYQNDEVIAETYKEGEPMMFKCRKIYTRVYAKADLAFVASVLLLMERETPMFNPNAGVTVFVAPMPV